MKSLGLLAAGFLAATQCHAAAEDWYRWRGPNLNGISGESGWMTQWPAGGPKVLWTASVGTGFSSFSVHAGRVFTMGNAADTDTVYCLDANSGKTLWKHSYPCPLDPKYFEGGPGSTPTVDDGRVYTFGRKGQVFCLNETNGAVVWSRNVATELGAEIPTWGFAGSPLIQDGLVILNVGEAGTALDKLTGKNAWMSAKSGAGYATAVPLPAPAKAVVIFAGKTVSAVENKTGALLWSYPWKTEYDVNAADPIVDGDRVFVSSGYNHGAAVIRAQGTQAKAVWENKNMRNQFNSSVLWKGHLYGVDEAELRCLAFDTGEVKWKFPQFGKGSLILADGKIVGLGEKGVLYIADATPDGFKPISQATVLNGKCWTTPVLSAGHIYCRNATGRVVCLDVGKQLAGSTP
jgi:outer membrane protein assembly factor BamB